MEIYHHDLINLALGKMLPFFFIAFFSFQCRNYQNGSHLPDSLFVIKFILLYNRDESSSHGSKRVHKGSHRLKHTKATTIDPKKRATAKTKSITSSFANAILSLFFFLFDSNKTLLYKHTHLVCIDLNLFPKKEAADLYLNNSKITAMAAKLRISIGTIWIRFDTQIFYIFSEKKKEKKDYHLYNLYFLKLRTCI